MYILKGAAYQVGEKEEKARIQTVEESQNEAGARPVKIESLGLPPRLV
jgi:hypothetical protein